MIVAAESDLRDSLEHVNMATRGASHPVVMLNHDKANNTPYVKDAVAEGVLAYIVEDLSAERGRPILDRRWPGLNTNRA